MTVINGNLCTLSIFITDGYYPMLCGTDLTLSVKQETILKTGQTSGAWREKVSRISEWSGSLTGLTPANTGNPVSWFYLLQESVRRKVQDFLYTFKDDDGNTKTIQGYALIVESDINGPMDLSTASIQFEGTGGLTFDPIAPVLIDFDILSDWWNTVNGQNYISGASATGSKLYTLTTGDTVLEVDVEGTEFDLVTGSPVGRQAQPNVSNHKVNFEQTFDGTQKVFVLFKRSI